jgi:hypothetical protein
MTYPKSIEIAEVFPVVDKTEVIYITKLLEEFGL